MRVPTVVLNVMRHLVAVLASTLLFLVFLAVLPLGLGCVTLLGVIVTVGLLAGGVCEGWVVRLITRSGAAAGAELQVLRTVPQLEYSGVLMCRRPASAATPVVIVGRYTVVSVVLVEALQRGWVSTQEVTALVVHARAYHRVAGTRRGEVAIAVMEAPWRLVVGFFRSVGRAFTWVPLGSLAWRMRGVVALVCVVQSVAEGRAWPGVLGAGVMALTYLVPAGGRAVHAQATAAGDAAVVAADLGGALVEVLDRGGQRMSLERRQRLETSPRSGAPVVTGQAPTGPARRLHLVRS